MPLSAQAQPKPSWTLVIHGGAGIIEKGRVTPEQEKGVQAGLDAALDAGAKVLAAGGSSLDAVQAAVQVLEDDPHFNAGRGAVFTWDATNELDAAIMDGSNRAAGSVAGTTTTRHPVAAARAVMEKSPHVLLAGPGADQFAREQGLEQVENSWFATPERRRQLDKMKANDKLGWFDVDLKYGTVGAVAMDSQGHVAAATSTGGLTGKRWGRIGDAPIIGAGTYADDRACAVSATGAGEFFIREGVAHEICARVRFKNETLQQAADVVMAETKQLGGSGGVIVTGPSGEMAWSFNTPGMYRGRASSNGDRLVAFYGDER
ncbi:isoaspartyl peptidase/L-asparaginase family protein [Sphingomonas sp. M1-B02]|uniref:isoaspartyl peptidase/L-asparaginase family protein n=1 Tax=Sphingomonas sp. M1-B02 TaxID=3114300 RepID=UPI00224009F9|nr:isoaspartyl peptidase/L-asparaginase [Sphingomonas sp. S6-11]UZK67998.1 isoaspartyl peptidase/L-asparaginase [Sphingomonas sp. S6-11]